MTKKITKGEPKFKVGQDVMVETNKPWTIARVKEIIQEDEQNYLYALSDGTTHPVSELCEATEPDFQRIWGKSKAQVEKARNKAQCEDSPTGAHVFELTNQGDERTGKTKVDGPCTHCGKLHSKVHPSRSTREDKPKQKKERKVMTATNGKLTVKDLAAKAGVDPKALRRLLRSKFGGGGGKLYEWDKNDPKVKEILKAAKGSNGKTEPVAATEPAAKKTTKPAAKKTTKPAAKKTTKTAAKTEPTVEPTPEPNGDSVESELQD